MPANFVVATFCLEDDDRASVLVAHRIFDEFHHSLVIRHVDQTPLLVIPIPGTHRHRTAPLTRKSSSDRDTRIATSQTRMDHDSNNLIPINDGGTKQCAKSLAKDQNEKNQQPIPSTNRIRAKCQNFQRGMLDHMNTAARKQVVGHDKESCRG